MRKQLCLLGMFVSMLVLLMAQTRLSSADEVFSNFGAGDSYETGNCWIISGSNSDTGFATRVGFSFVNSGSDVNLDTIELAVSGFTDSKAITVTINADNGGNPGAELESFDTLAIGSFGSSNSIVKVTSITRPLLVSGATYYVVLRTNPAGSNGKVAWYWNNVNMKGSYRYSPDGGTTWYPSYVDYSTFRVIGTAPAALSGLSINPSTIPGGSTATGTVTLASAVGVPTVVSLSSLNSAAHVPASVSVPANATSATFTVTTDSVVANKIGKITASLSGVSSSVNVTVKPVVFLSLALVPASVHGGQGSVGTVKFSGPVDADKTISLASANPAAHVPATVTVTAGNSSATFPITTDPVAANITGAITATFGALVKTASVTVKSPLLSAFTLVPNNVIGGTSITGTVTVNGPTAVNTSVAITSFNSAAHPPASVVILAGATSASFPVPIDAVLVNTAGAVSASLNGITKNINLTVKAPTYLSFTLVPNPVKGGNSVTGTVTMSGPVAADTVVTLTNMNAKAALPGPTVTIPAGSSSVTFTVTTMPTAVNATGAVKAQIGAVAKQVTLKVTP